MTQDFNFRPTRDIWPSLLTTQSADPSLNCEFPHARVHLSAFETSSFQQLLYGQRLAERSLGGALIFFVNSMVYELRAFARTRCVTFDRFSHLYHNSHLVFPCLFACVKILTISCTMYGIISLVDAALRTSAMTDIFKVIYVVRQ